MGGETGQYDYRLDDRMETLCTSLSELTVELKHTNQNLDRAWKAFEAGQAETRQQIGEIRDELHRHDANNPGVFARVQDAESRVASLEDDQRRERKWRFWLLTSIAGLALTVAANYLGTLL